MTTAKKTFVQKSVTVGIEDTTLKSLNDAAKSVGAGTDAVVGIGGATPRDADQTEFFTHSATFSWSEEV